MQPCLINILQVLSARVCQRRVIFFSVVMWVTTIGQLASAAEFIPFLAQPNHEFSQAYGISDDGMVVAGKSSVGESLPQAFRWTDASGMVGLGTLPGDTFSVAGSNGSQPLSGDGSTIVGNSYNQDTFTNQAIIHTAAQGMRSIDVSRPDRWTYPFGVSHDGSVVTGNTETRPYTQNGSFREAFRWTEADGLVGLGHLAGNNQSYASDISGDGSLIVGTSNWWFRSDDGEIEAGESEVYKWTEATGMVGTGILPSTRQVKVSGDGAIISGTAFVSSDTDQEAFYWTAGTGCDRSGLGSRDRGRRWCHGFSGP